MIGKQCAEEYKDSRKIIEQRSGALWDGGQKKDFG